MQMRCLSLPTRRVQSFAALDTHPPLRMDTTWVRLDAKHNRQSHVDAFIGVSFASQYLMCELSFGGNINASA
jgi:hypothetical protein